MDQKAASIKSLCVHHKDEDVGRSRDGSPLSRHVLTGAIPEQWL